MADGRPGMALRLGAVLVFIGLPILAIATTAISVTDAMETRTEVVRRQSDLELLTARLSRSDAPDGTPNLMDVWLPGNTRSVAVAELQQHLIDIVAASSGDVIEVQEEGDGDAEGIVVVRITFRATNDALLATLHAVEAGIPLMTVTSLIVAAARGTGEAEDGSLRVDLKVASHRLAEDAG